MALDIDGGSAVDATTREAPAGFYPPTVSPPREPLPLTRFLFRFLDNPLASVPQIAYEQPLTVYPLSGSIKVAWVCAPELTEQILLREADAFSKSPMEKRVFEKTLGDSLLTADGAHWRWQRKTMAPLFRQGEILSYVPKMAEAAGAAARRWTRAEQREIDQDMIDVTFQVIARTMLDEGTPADDKLLIAETHAYLARVPWEMAWTLLRLPKWLPHPATWRMNLAASRLRACIQGIIDRRRANPPAASNDLLDRLLAARHTETGEPMTDAQLVNNLLTLLEAGHETTARALTFTLYLLARSSYWQDAVRDEVQTVVGTGAVEAHHVERLTMLRQVINESLRLYPPAPVFARQAVRPIEVGGEVFQGNDQIVIPTYAIQRHRQLWDDPDRFDPSRFAGDRLKSLPRTQFMPFGVGPRVCIGMSFAMVEAQVLLATFLQAARFKWDGRHEPEPVSRITLRPKGGMPLLVAPL